jgi:seryl-tRNA synthetase
MHDIRWIRENPDAFDEGLKRRFLAPEAASLLAIDAKRRAVLTGLQEIQARRNDASKEIGRARGAGEEALAKKLIKEVAGLKDEVQKGEEEAKKLEKELDDALASIPNLPADDVPEGRDEEANVEREDHRFGAPPKFDFAPKQHFELGEAGGLMDFETAAKLSGARFVVLKGALARLERALAQFMLDLQTGENGYTEVNPPLMVRNEVMFGTAQLPKFRKDQFKTERSADIDDLSPTISVAADEFIRLRHNQYPDGKLPNTQEIRDQYLKHIGVRVSEFLGVELNLSERDPNEPIDVPIPMWLIPTAEVPLTNLVRESILDEAELPLRFTAFTPCFRAEAGAAGKDTRGMIRQHQFEKVELVSITTPELSAAEHERMLACAEEVLKRLRLPFRVVTLATGDMGFAARKTYDIEVWLPGQGTYREISSCSNCGEFQARRMNARYRKEGAKQLRFVHTLNGSGLAVGRTLVAVLENCQQADGSVTIPEALLPYMGGITRIGGVAGQGEGG